MRRIFQNKLLSLVIALSIVFTVFIGLTASRRDRVSIFEGVVGNVLNPVQKYLYMGGKRVSNLFSFITNISTIKSDNELLRIKVVELENKLIDYETAKTENERLREMLGFKDEHNKYSYLGANVIGKGSGNWYDVFIIDKGSNQGVKKSYPVVVSRGLVGQVMEVGPNWSKVLSIVDEKSRVSGVISGSGFQGMIQGMSGLNGEKMCKMLYLPANADVKEGDIVVTSGISQFFPENIKIGVISEMEDEMTEFVKTAVVKSDVDFTRLEEVFVITNAISDDDYPVEGN